MGDRRSGCTSHIPRIPIYLFAVLALAAGLDTVPAQVDEGRPLRTVRSEAFPSIPHSSLLIPHSSLLTPSALEQELTQRYIAHYTSPAGVAWLNAVMERGSLYLPFIKEEIAKRRLPPELAYLPVIESGFLGTARSRSGAVGLWQFMLNSINPLDIKVNNFMDERRDFQKSTRAALVKLQDNYRVLGDWALALAAYNCGLGAVNRMIQNTKTRDYWELCAKNEMKHETVHYVPKFLAASWVLSQPRRFGVDCWPDVIEWTAIPLERQVSLDLLAEEAGVEEELLRRLNAELLIGISPADRNYRLKVPAAQLPQIREVLQREDGRLLRYHYYVIRQGDTLSALARHYDVPLNLIEEHNPGISNRYLKIGETILIPAVHGRIENSRLPPAPMPAQNLSFEGTHAVRRGETLWSLGIKYGVDPQTLAEANNIELNQILPEGKLLKVPIME